MSCLSPVVKYCITRFELSHPFKLLKRGLCAVILVGISFYSFGQESNAVTAALAKAAHDTVRVKILSEQSEKAPDGVWEAYTAQLKKLTETKLAEERNPRLRKFYSRYLAVSLNNLGLDESNKGNYVKSAEYWEESQKVARQAGDVSLEATALSNLCRQYYNGGQLEKALDGFHRALKIYRSTNDKSRVATSLNYLGDIYRTQNDLPNAIKSYTESRQLLEESRDLVRLADTFNRLGMVSTLQKDETQAMSYYTRALAIYEQKGLKRGAIGIQFQIGKLKHQMGKSSEALGYYHETLALLKKTEQNYILINCLAGMGQAYFFLGQLDSANYYFDQHIRMDKDFKYPDILLESTRLSYLVQKQKGNASAALAMHELYLRAKDSIYNDDSRKAMLKSQYKYEYDKKALLDSLKSETEKNAIATKLVQEQNQRLKIEAEKNIAEARRLRTETERDMLEANLSQEKSERYKIETERNVMEARRLKAETEKKALEVNLIQERNQRYGLLGGLILILMTAGFGFSQYRTRQRLKELKLRNQIASDLHDEVGSAISSISLFAGMARMKNTGNTRELVEKIEETSRETINTMSDIVWSIEPANDSFFNVLRKMKQFGEQLTGPLNIAFQFAAGPGVEKLSLDMKQRKNIFLVYKEAVNNSCKHAQATIITTDIRIASNTIVMSVSDNGRGFNVMHDSAGYGKGSMKARTADLNGKLDIVSTPETGTRITLTFPY